MQEIIKEFTEEIENTKKCMMECMYKELDIQDMSADELRMLQTVLRLLDISTKFTIAQAETIDEINKKLDRSKN